MTVMINYLYNHCQGDPVLKAVCNHWATAVCNHQAQSQAQQGARGQGVSNKRPPAVDGSIPSLPPISPTLGEGLDGLTFLDIPGLEWDTQLGIAQKGLFPVACRLSIFLPAWQRITLDKFVLEVIRQWYSLPFLRPPPLSLSPVETPLPRLQCKQLVLWEEVSSLLTKRAVETLDLSRDQGGFYSHYFLATKHSVGFHPFNLQPTRTQLVYTSCQVPYGNPHLSSAGSSQRLADGVAGSQRRLFACADTPQLLLVSLVCSQEPGTGAHCLPMKFLPFGLATAPRDFTKLLAPLAAHLHLQGCLMHRRHHPCTCVSQSDSAHPRYQSMLSLQAGFYHKHQEVGPCPVSGNAPLGSSDRYSQGIGLSIPRSDRNDSSSNSGLSRPNPGLCSTPASGDRAACILPSCHAQVPLCMFRLHPLSNLVRDHFDMRVDCTSKLIPLSSPVIRSALEFWSRRDLVSQGVPLHILPPTHVLMTDASTYGWVAVCGPLTARGCGQAISLLSI